MSLDSAETACPKLDRNCPAITEIVPLDPRAPKRHALSWARALAFAPGHADNNFDDNYDANDADDDDFDKTNDQNRNDVNNERINPAKATQFMGRMQNKTAT